MNATRKSLPALFAGVLATALAASAAEQTLPTPPPGGFPDTESSVNVPLPDWPDLGRRVTLTLSAHATPSNCVQIAFGRDANGDENLEPEETDLVLGVDCGVPFVREERAGGRCRCTVETNQLCSPSTYTYAFRQPSAPAERFSFAKVTTRGRDESAAEIAAEITTPGTVLILQ